MSVLTLLLSTLVLLHALRVVILNEREIDTVLPRVTVAGSLHIMALSAFVWHHTAEQFATTEQTPDASAQLLLPRPTITPARCGRMLCSCGDEMR